MIQALKRDAVLQAKGILLPEMGGNLCIIPSPIAVTAVPVPFCLLYPSMKIYNRISYAQRYIQFQELQPMFRKILLIVSFPNQGLHWVRYSADVGFLDPIYIHYLIQQFPLFQCQWLSFQNCPADLLQRHRQGLNGVWLCNIQCFQNRVLQYEASAEDCHQHKQHSLMIFPKKHCENNRTRRKGQEPIAAQKANANPRQDPDKLICTISFSFTLKDSVAAGDEESRCRSKRDILPHGETIGDVVRHQKIPRKNS